MSARGVVAALLLAGAPVFAAAAAPPAAAARTFATPEEAVRALIATVKSRDVTRLIALFGPEGQDLVDTSDEATGRRNRQVFLAAVAEGWRLVDAGAKRKELVLGNEGWPFPVPIVQGGAGWSFDAAAGKDEVLSRRIGRNELAVIRVLGSYVAAQRAYAAAPHDGKRAGLYARRFGSDPGTQNGLYWPARRGEAQSPLGVLVAQATTEGYHRRDGETPTPLYGYYFRILEGQGASAPGGAADYVKDGDMSGGFALVAWPVHYGASGIMTFIVNKDGIAQEKDLGPETPDVVTRLTRYDPDRTWHRVEPAPRHSAEGPAGPSPAH
jgi:DUF2950 family protein